MKHTNKNTRLAAIKWWKSLDNFSRNEVISKYVRGAKFLGRTLSSLTGRECEELYLSMTPATPSPLPETGKKVITKDGEVLPMNETETEVFHFGTWKEIQEDQDGELYIMGGLNAIYIDYLTPVQKPLPETETGVRVGDHVFHEVYKEYGEVWEIVDNEYCRVDFGKGRFTNGKTKISNLTVVGGKNPTPPTPGNDRQEWENWSFIKEKVRGEIARSVFDGKAELVASVFTDEDGRLIASAPDMYRALKRLLPIIEAERTQTGVSLSIRYLTEYEEAKAILNSITGGK